MRWYYYRQKERIGPVEESAIKKLVADGTLKPADYVWNEGMGNQWAHVADVPELKDVIKPVKSAVAAAAFPVAAAAVSAVAAAPSGVKSAGSSLKLAKQAEQPVDPGVEERAAAVIAEREAAQQLQKAQHRRFFGYSCPQCGDRLHRSTSEGARKWFGVAGILFSMAFGELYCNSCGVVERSELPASDRLRMVIGSFLLVITAIVLFIVLVLLANWADN